MIDGTNKNHIMKPKLAMFPKTTFKRLYTLTLLVLISTPRDSLSFVTTIPIQNKNYPSFILHNSLPQQQQRQRPLLSTSQTPYIATNDNKNSTTSRGKKKFEPESILDLAYVSNPSLRDAHVPFIDPLGNNFLDCRLSFVVEIDDIPYTIGTPHDATVALTHLEKSTGRDIFLSADDPNMDELFKIASLRLMSSCDDLQLKRTPGVLTVHGDLDKYVEAGYKERLGEDLSVDAMAKILMCPNTEEDEKFFDDTMKKLLGDKYDDDEDDEEEIDQEILDMFDFDALLNDESEDEEELEDMLKEMFLTDEDVDEDTIKEMDDELKDAIAERLFTFEYEERMYSLVKMLQPAIILGRDDPQVDNRRILLTPDEMNVIKPKVEEIFKEKLKDMGILLP